MAAKLTFAEWLRRKARAAGYEVDGRGGGRTELAAAAGMSLTQIGRTLEGKTVPSVESQRGLAKALRVPLLEVMIQSGSITREDIFGPGVTEEDVQQHRTPPPSPDDLLAQLGVTDPDDQAVIFHLIDRLKAHRGE